MLLDPRVKPEDDEREKEASGGVELRVTGFPCRSTRMTHYKKTGMTEEKKRREDDERKKILERSKMKPVGQKCFYLIFRNKNSMKRIWCN